MPAERARSRQNGRRWPRPPPDRTRLRARGHRRHCEGAAERRRRVPPREQGARRPSAHRRHDQERRDRSHREHDGRQAGHPRVEFHPSRGRAQARHVLHHAGCGPCDMRGSRPSRRGRGQPSAGSPQGGRRSMKRTPMTLRGAEALRTELKKLKSEARPNVIKAIAEARGHGDLSENAEYHAAREQQGFIEGRISEIENKLSTAEIIDTSRLASNGRVVFGASVELEDQDDGGRVKYQIVGEDEAEIRAGRVSITSPIARALVGKSPGDVVDVSAPGGIKSYEVVSVRYE